MFTGRGGPHPTVVAKEIRAIRLLERCRPLARADVAPFLAAYGACLAAALSYAVARQWESVLWASGAAGACVFAHVLLTLFAHWIVDVRSFVGYTECSDPTRATHCKVTPVDFAGTKELVVIDHRKSEAGEDLLGFEYRKQRFCYDSQAGAFTRLKYPAEDRFADYQRSSGYGHEGKVLAAMEHWGPNRFDVPLPQFTDMLKEQLLAPFFVFQVFCVGLWCLDSYWWGPQNYTRCM